MQSQPPGEFAQLTARFADFCENFACRAAGQGQPARDMLATLRQWAGHMTAAQEAAARAPETDRVLAHAWGARLVDILQDARRMLSDSPVSIDHHETGIPLPRIAKPAPQPVARPAGRRPSHPRRRSR
ncbi:hypothetical protein GN316_08405 [Xylophilus sp. Kf1]|nr:hypothetical protein [Xylophilus sp. Kf1]